MTLRLMDLEAPLDDVELPNGTKHVPVPFGPKEYQLWRDLAKETDARERGRIVMQIVRACYPTVTDDDLASCTPRMWLAMAAHAGHRIEQVRDALKNVDAAALAEYQAPPEPAQATTTPPSPRRKSGSTSSPRSPKRSAKTGGTPTGPGLTASPT